MTDGRLVEVTPWRCQCGHEERDLRAMKAHVAAAHPPKPDACPRWPRLPECATAGVDGCPGAEACKRSTGAMLSDPVEMARWLDGVKRGEQRPVEELPLFGGGVDRE